MLDVTADLEELRIVRLDKCAIRNGGPETCGIGIRCVYGFASDP